MQQNSPSFGIRPYEFWQTDVNIHVTTAKTDMEDISTIPDVPSRPFIANTFPQPQLQETTRLFSVLAVFPSLEWDLSEIMQSARF